MVKYLENQILIIADHASNYVPKENNKLGLTNSFLNQHIAFDIGIKELSAFKGFKLINAMRGINQKLIPIEGIVI